MHQYLGGERIKTMNFSIENMRKCHPVKAQPIRLLALRQRQMQYCIGGHAPHFHQKAKTINAPCNCM